MTKPKAEVKPEEEQKGNRDQAITQMTHDLMEAQGEVTMLKNQVRTLAAFHNSVMNKLMEYGFDLQLYAKQQLIKEETVQQSDKDITKMSLKENK